jgi:hypothetical protein
VAEIFNSNYKLYDGRLQQQTTERREQLLHQGYLRNLRILKGSILLLHLDPPPHRCRLPHHLLRLKNQPAKKPLPRPNRQIPNPQNTIIRAIVHKGIPETANARTNRSFPNQHPHPHVQIRNAGLSKNLERPVEDQGQPLKNTSQPFPRIGQSKSKNNSNYVI